MNSIVPYIFISAQVIIENGVKVMQIDIPKSRAIVATLQGRLLRRLKQNGKPENIPMFPYEITTRLSDLSLLDFSDQVIYESHQNAIGYVRQTGILYKFKQ